MVLVAPDTHDTWNPEWNGVRNIYVIVGRLFIDHVLFILFRTMSFILFDSEQTPVHITNWNWF